MKRQKNMPIDAVELKRTYESLVSLTDNDDFYKLSELEIDVLRMAKRIVHNAFRVEKWPEFTKKLETGGVEELNRETQ
jgi:hypothetical protein